MSARFKSIISSIILLIPFLLAHSAHASLAGGAAVLIDPGHSTASGCPSGFGNACPGSCREAELNWKVGYRVYWVMKNICGYSGMRLSKSEDECTDVNDRWRLANSLVLDGFVSVHHNACNASNGFMMYCNIPVQEGRFHGGLASWMFAQRIADKFLDYGIYMDPPYCEDFDLCTRVEHKGVLRENRWTATMGEPYSTGDFRAQAICHLASSPEFTNEVYSYVSGISAALSPTSVGTSFIATQGFPEYRVNLSWQESNPARSLTFFGAATHVGDPTPKWQRS